MKKFRLFLFSVLVLAGLLVLSADTYAAEGRIPISAAGTIAQSGSYFLSQDILASGDAIIITADHVTLNLDGHTITVNGAFTAIQATGTDVEVRNGKLVSLAISGSGDGVHFERAAGEFRARDLNITGFPGAGILVSGCAGASARLIATGNTVQGGSSFAGIYLACVEASRIEQNQLRESFVGIWMEASVNSIVVNNVVSQNFDDGILLANGSSNNTVERNTVTQNGGDGIHLYSSNSGNCSANNIVYNNASNNTGSGISLDGAAPGLTNFNQVSYNVTSINAADGIVAKLVGSYNALDWNQSSGNTGAGMRLAGTNNVFSNNRAKLNGGGGYVVTGAGNINVVINTSPVTETNY